MDVSSDVKTFSQDEPITTSSPSSDVGDSSKQIEEKEPEDHFLTGPKLYVLIAALSLAVFLFALDMSILVTAIPLITEKFHSTDDIGWYVSAYMLSL